MFQCIAATTLFLEWPAILDWPVKNDKLYLTGLLKNDQLYLTGLLKMTSYIWLAC